MNKHAFLILAHEKEDILRALLEALDDERCDVFLHIDAKASYKDTSFRMKNSRLVVLPRHIDARWADFSLVEVELALIEAADKNDNYDYLHLISGVDYPLHGVSYIIDFCSKHKGKEFIGFAQNVKPQELNWRTGRRFLFSRDFKNPNIIKRIIRKGHAVLQSLPGCGRKINAEIKKGSQWCSFTSDFAKYVISQKDWLIKNFKGTFCPDELVMQTLCWNSHFRECIYDKADEFHGAMRYIPWVSGCLSSLTTDDYQSMSKSEAFFGRKFMMEDIKRYTSNSQNH